MILSIIEKLKIKYCNYENGWWIFSYNYNYWQYYVADNIEDEIVKEMTDFFDELTVYIS